jgi:hypothetical protein
MANTFVDYTGDNTTTSFAFSIPYLDDSHIVVQVDQASVPGGTFVTKTLTTDYTIQTSPSNAIIFNSAPATGDRIRIKRVSDSSTALVDFENGSVLTEVELDRAYLHNLYLNEEIAEGSGNNTMVKDSVTGNFNGDLARIANVADPVDPQDVTTKNFTEATYVNTAGDTMTGVLSMGTNKITNVVDPTTNTDAATKNYVDDTIATSFATGTPPPGNTIGTSNLDDDAVTYAKLQNVAANNVLLGNDNGAGSDAQELTATEVRTILNVADGATVNDTDANLKNRANHTGTQTAATISDFDTEVANNSAVVANTAKVGLTDNSVTAARISDTDTTFNVGTNVGIGAVASGNYKLEVAGDIAAYGTGNKFIISHSTNSLGYLEFYSGGEGLNQKKGRIVAFSGKMQFAWVNDNGTAGVVVQLDQATGGFEPNADNAQPLGAASKRWSVVYAGSGTINTSDRNQKEEIEELSEAELRVAQACKGLVRKFKFKGGTRKHIGVIAQDVRDAFSAEGLDAHEYGLFCSDTWTDEDTGEEVTQLGIRYEELLAFIISAL